ncbi:MAG: SprT-like domain-containing protein [Paludibacteraceae bacterium]|nr:SprT-like domain-containing protein [Paludibacteraceae bacterium]
MVETLTPQSGAMQLTVADLHRWFLEFNPLYFDGQLPEPSWKIGRRKSSVLGYFRPDCSLIAVSAYYPLDEQAYRTTLLHEMIHLWQHAVLHLRRGNHGDTFRQKAEAIRRQSDGRYVITRCTRLPEQVVQTRAEAPKPVNCYVFVWPDGDGYALCRASGPNLRYLYRQVLQPRFSEIRLYLCRGVEFRRMRNSRKVAHYYKYSAADWQTKIQPAVCREISLPKSLGGMFINILKNIR